MKTPKHAGEPPKRAVNREPTDPDSVGDIALAALEVGAARTGTWNTVTPPNPTPAEGGRPPKSGKARRHFSNPGSTAETAKRLFAFLAHRGSPAEFLAAHPGVNARQVDAILSAARFSLLNKAPGWTWIPEERPTSLFAHYLKAGDYGPEQEG